jgi:hypothetical protein
MTRKTSPKIFSFGGFMQKSHWVMLLLAGASMAMAEGTPKNHSQTKDDTQVTSNDDSAPATLAEQLVKEGCNTPQ